jgi:hypothetical protein
MRGSFCATLTLTLSLEGEGMSVVLEWLVYREGDENAGMDEHDE